MRALLLKIARPLCLTGTLLLGACVAPPLATQYDFGLPQPPASGAAAAPAAIDAARISVSAPPWLDGTALLYRPAYATPGALSAYARSAWIAPPAALLQQRLREAATMRQGAGGAAAVRSVPLRLHVELDEFSQVFTGAQSSQAQLRARVALLGAQRDGTLAQRRFVIDVPAATPDAAGARQALRQAADAFIDQTLDWVAPLAAGAPDSP